MDDLSEALRWLRERIGLSREELAAASGVSAVHIKFIERGKRNPSREVVERLLPSLRVTRADLDGLLELRPWAASTSTGTAATLAAYAAGVPLRVNEGDEFSITAHAAPARPPAAPMAPVEVAPAPAPAAFRSAQASETVTLEAELIELRERYVHLPRSKQEMVLGWLRALDDR